jgi:hypothetical protein
MQQGYSNGGFFFGSVQEVKKGRETGLVVQIEIEAVSKKRSRWGN